MSANGQTWHAGNPGRALSTRLESGIIGQVDSSQIQAAFGDVFDQAIVFHGFADYMRDLEVFIYATADPRTGIQPEHLLHRFTHCVRAVVTTAVSPEVWKQSLDERLIDYDQGRDLDGYVWGVKRAVLYPGMKLVPNSAEARRWSRELGLPFHEAAIETNGQLGYASRDHPRNAPQARPVRQMQEDGRCLYETAVFSSQATAGACHLECQAGLRPVLVRPPSANGIRVWPSRACGGPSSSPRGGAAGELAGDILARLARLAWRADFALDSYHPGQRARLR